MRTRFGLLLPCLGAAVLTACSSSSNPDAGFDAGAPDGGFDAGFDGGLNPTCAPPGTACEPTFPCCDANDICDPSSGLCVPDAGVSGGTTGGSGFPSDGAQWVQEAVKGGTGIIGLTALSTPSPTVQVAAGTAPALGTLVSRSGDAGWSPVTGTPPASALLGVWADSSGDVFAAGAVDGGTALLVAGRLDGGLKAVGLDAGPPLSELQAVVGLGPNEAVAAGIPAANALHLLPDGGLALEPLPGGLTRVYRMVTGPNGFIYALADSSNAQISVILERDGGVWTEFPVLGAVNLSDIAAGSTGDVLAVGDDDNGNGLAFGFVDGGVDGGFTSYPTPALPPLTAICEPQEGELFVAAAAVGGNPPLILRDQGGVWQAETLPAGAETISAIASDPQGDLFAVGVQPCGGCAGYPLALRRVP
ncbi:MAG TPA: hypothetical protein VMB50_00935 [Myxococcales bacterium]|nr:hypothetical protein [Myxococcales bacterium]